MVNLKGFGHSSRRVLCGKWVRCYGNNENKLWPGSNNNTNAGPVVIIRLQRVIPP
jgi:hypothetical protein